jgi:hypothetical protein
MEEIDRAILALKAAVKLSKNNGGVNDAAHDFTLYLVLLVRDQIRSYVEDSHFYLRDHPLFHRNQHRKFATSFGNRHFPCMLPSPDLHSSFLPPFCGK